MSEWFQMGWLDRMKVATDLAIVILPRKYGSGAIHIWKDGNLFKAKVEVFNNPRLNKLLEKFENETALAAIMFGKENIFV